MKIIKTIIAVSFCMGLASVQADLINYDLSNLSVDSLGAVAFDTTRTYPDANTGSFYVMDPSGNGGRLDRMVTFSFGSVAKVQTFTGNLSLKAYGTGFSGSEVLDKTSYGSQAFIFKNSGTFLYLLHDTVMWVGREVGDEWGNATAFNDMAYGYKLTDNGDGIASEGDVIELVGIVYSTGADSVFGQTADQLTSIAIPEPATIGMLGFGALMTLMIRRLRG